MSCRLPGADSPGALWELLRQGRESIEEIPPDRWEADRYYDPRPGARGKMNTRRGGFLGDIKAFDARFFGIAPREATWMDPQQRVALEATWEAFESGGIPVPELAASHTGVFLGISAFDYAHLFHAYSDRTLIDPYMALGNTHAIAANRISYLFDFRGPSLALDTGCSSSSLAIHLACQSLRLRECNLAVAGGVSVVLAPEISVGFSRARMLSGDGRCKTFDERADGYVRSEGCAMLVLKRLCDALQDDDLILGIIRGTATNQDGRTVGITAPSGAAQQEVIREALARAGVEPSDVSYVEAHGTGTKLGDPVEVGALAEIFGRDDSRRHSCVVGSVKANVGHTESVAGAVGLIKLLLCMKHELIPRQLHLERLNPKFPPHASRLVFPTQAVPWPRGERPRIAGVNSFGFGGSNVHLVVEEPPVRRRRTPEADRPRHVIALSAKTPSALGRMAARFRARLAESEDEALADLCFSANAGRAHFDHRLAASGRDHQEVLAAFDAFLQNGTSSGLRSGVARKQSAPKIALLFTGQGAQYPGMGRALYQTQPIFRGVLDRAADLVRGELERDLRSVMFGDELATKELGRTEYTQPALLALEYALAELWRSWGVEPDCVVGHSLGEYTAACVAGVFSFEQALWLVTRRGRFMQSPDCRGKMAAVFESADRVRAFLSGDTERGADIEKSVAIAALNGPRNTVISGRSGPVDAVVALLDREGIRWQWLPAQTGFHSPCLDGGLDQFEEAARQVDCRAPEIPLISNVTGEPLQGAPDASYWRRQAREAVRFAPCMERLASLDCNTFLEAGPHPTLSTMGRAHLSDPSLTWAASLRRGRDDWTQLLDALASLYTRGIDVDWKGFDREYHRVKVSIPTYPFEREHHWLDDLVQDKRRRPGGRSPRSQERPLLGRRLLSAREGHQFEDRIGLDRYPLLADHRVCGMAVVPATAYVSLAVEAARQVLGEKPIALSQIRFDQALSVRQGEERVVQTLVEPVAAGSAAFRVCALAEGGEGQTERWTEHASGVLEHSGDSNPSRSAPKLAEARARCTEEVAQEELYSDLSRRSLEYGPAFQTVRQLWRRDGEALARIQIRIPRPDDSRYSVHPALLDGCFQSLAAAVGADEPLEELSATYTPSRVERIAMAQALPQTLWSYGRLRTRELEGESIADLDLYDDRGNSVAEIRGLHLARPEQRQESAARPVSLAGCFYERIWTEAASSETTCCHELPRGQVWLLLADRGGVAGRLAAQISERGGEPLLVFAGDCFQRYGDHEFQIDPGRPEDLHKLMEATFSNGGGVSHEIRIVHLWALDFDAEASPELLARAGREAWGGVLGLLQICGRMRHLKPTHLYLVTRNAHTLPEEEGPVSLAGSLLWGLGRVARLEYPNLGCTQIDLGPEPCQSDAGIDLARELTAPPEDDQVALRAGRRFAARLRRLPPRDRNVEMSHDPAESLRIPEADPYRLELGEGSKLNGFVYRPVHRRPPPPGTVEVGVEAAGLNFRDVLSAMGRYPGGPIPLGSEFAGVVTAVGRGSGEDAAGLRTGDPVFGFAPWSFGSHTVSLQNLVFRRPSTLTPQQAAAIPVAFLTAHYALRYLARLTRGERVLIHAAAGGVGVAAVKLAQRVGAEIFATAGSPEKRDFVASLGVRYVMDSRSLEFATDIAQATGGEGVDVVLNSLAGEFIPKSLASLRPYGRFVEIGKADIMQDRKLGMLPFRNNLSFFAVDLDALCRDRPELARRLFLELVQAFELGELTPPPITEFSAEQAGAAFRYMARRQNIGKIVISMPSHTGTEAAARPRPAPAEATYVIAGGCGGVGLHLARWLVERGIRALALLGRSGASAEAEETLASLRARGAQVRVARVDIADRVELARVLDEIRRGLPAIRGVIHAAGVTRDTPIHKMSLQAFEEVLRSKVQGAWNLHQLTQDDDLDLFLLCSSITSVLGSPGQANYAAANAFVDALARYRRSRGLCATAINWGAWTELGLAARPGLRDRLARRGLGTIEPEEGLTALDELLSRQVAQAVVAPVDWSRFLDGLRDAPLRRFVTPVAVESKATGEAPPPRPTPTAAVAGTDLASLTEAEGIQELVKFMRAQLATATQMKADDLDPDVPLADLGVDSLVVVELVDHLETNFQIELPLEELRDDPTLHNVARLALTQAVTRKAHDAGATTKTRPSAEAFNIE